MFKQLKDTNILNTINNNRSDNKDSINSNLSTLPLKIKIKEIIDKIDELIFNTCNDCFIEHLQEISKTRYITSFIKRNSLKDKIAKLICVLN